MIKVPLCAVLNDFILQVFMLRGIHKKWKQPIYFNFCNGSTKHPDIMRTIKMIVRAVREAGLQILAVVCDQGTNNVSAIKKLIADTSADYKRVGKVQKKEFVFEVDGETICPFTRTLFPTVLERTRQERTPNLCV